MVDERDLMSGREALNRLDNFVQNARDDFDSATRTAESHSGRLADVLRLTADGYRELARIRLDLLKSGAAEKLSEAERKAIALLDEHAAFVAGLGGRIEEVEKLLKKAEDRRREGDAAVAAALEAYEGQVAQTEASLETDPAYLALKQAAEEARSIAARAEQKLELAKQDREAKRAPYESDPLFTYLWTRKFRTPDYRKRGLSRMLDNWVAKTCGYDAAHLNYARLIELPDRIAEHKARMELEEAEATAAIERFEAQKLEADGAKELAAKLAKAREELKRLDQELANVEAARSQLREEQEQAAAGRGGPYEDACKIIQEGLRAASFPDLKVLAAETVEDEDDRIVNVLVRLRTEEIELSTTRRASDPAPQRLRTVLDVIETARRRFRQAGLDRQDVVFLRPAFDAALAAYGRGPDVELERLWKALMATLRSAPGPDDQYFGGRGRQGAIGLEDVLGGVAGVVLREALRRSSHGRWGGGGGWSGGSSSGGWGGGSRGGGRIGGGGFKTGGRIGGGGFKTGGRF